MAPCPTRDRALELLRRTHVGDNILQRSVNIAPQHHAFITRTNSMTSSSTGAAVARPAGSLAAPAQRTSLVLFALAMGGFAIGTAEFAVMSLLPYFSVGLGVDGPTAGHVISAYALGVVAGAPVIAVLAAKLSRRTLLIGLMAAFAITNSLSALAPTYGWMLVFRFLSGLPHGA